MFTANVEKTNAVLYMWNSPTRTFTARLVLFGSEYSEVKYFQLWGLHRIGTEFVRGMKNIRMSWMKPSAVDRRFPQCRSWLPAPFN